MKTTAILNLSRLNKNVENKEFSIFEFTKKHGGFFSSSRLDNGLIKVSVRTRDISKPISETGSSFAEACVNTMKKYENLISKFNA